jgi:hypothetical protein
VNNACSLFGTTKPFSAALLEKLYPTHTVYVAEMEKAVSHDVASGALLAPDAQEIVRAAQIARVPIG